MDTPPTVPESKQSEPDTTSPTPSGQTDDIQAGIIADTPKKRHWFTRRNILAAIGMLIVLGILFPKGHKENASTASTPQAAVTAPTSATDNPAQTASPAATTPASAAPAQKTYFDSVTTHLKALSTLSDTQNASCAVSFPPPEPCATNIKAYQAELLNAKADLAQVTAPVSFQQADVSLRGALDADIAASNLALQSLKNKDIANWLKALGAHGQAGQTLLQAGSQALKVLQ